MGRPINSKRSLVKKNDDEGEKKMNEWGWKNKFLEHVIS